MPIVDIVRDAKPRPIAPIDESVVIPDAVKRAAAHSEAFYSANPPTPAPQSIPFDVSPVVMRQVEPVNAPAPPELQTATPPPLSLQPAAPPAPELQSNTLPHSDNDVRAMAGRLKKQSATINDLQNQMTMLGDELMATQRRLQDAPPLQPTQAPQPLLSEQELRDYGPEFVDVVKRAAREAVSPDVARLQQENEQLRRATTEQARRAMYTHLDTQVPNWRNVNHSPAFKMWLRLRDPYSGSIRQQMLDAAFQTADALRVSAFFQGFLSEEAASPAVQDIQAPQPQPAPVRQPAIALETLAAPGRARSAPPAPVAEKPTYTRSEIAKFYADVRKGLWVGHEVEKTRIERDIFAAQNDGRIRG